MKIINYLFIIIALVVVSSCEKVMDLPDRDAKKLTMDGIILPDSTYVSVSLTLDNYKDIWSTNEINEYESKRDNFCRTGIK